MSEASKSKARVALKSGGTRKAPARKLRVGQVEAALRATSGIQAAAARKLGTSRQAIAGFIKRNVSLQKVVEEVVETTLDVAEAELIKQLASGNMTAIIFYLKTKGKDRGYSERQEHVGKGNTALVPLAPEAKDMGELELARRVAFILRNGEKAAGATVH
tara:strand:+ start:86 stop:565 length:480 start_codon:yes stop_codon:yes gene_type:complete